MISTHEAAGREAAITAIAAIARASDEGSEGAFLVGALSPQMTVFWKKKRSLELPPSTRWTPVAIAGRFLKPGLCPHVHVHAQPRLDI